jgi:hypothetical protein
MCDLTKLLPNFAPEFISTILIGYIDHVVIFWFHVIIECIILAINLTIYQTVLYYGFDFNSVYSSIFLKKEIWYHCKS